MPTKRKHVKKVRVAPRTDANQGVREHIERVRKQNEYIIKKLAEYRAKQEEAKRAAEEMAKQSTSQTIDGFGSDRDIANE